MISRSSPLFSFCYFFVFLLTLSMAFPWPILAQQLSEKEIQAQEQKLQAEYDELQKDIARWEQVLNETRAKASTIQGDISYLNAKIKEAELTIKAKNIAIQQLSKDIGSKTEKIGELEGRIAR